MKLPRWLDPERRIREDDVAITIMAHLKRETYQFGVLAQDAQIINPDAGLIIQGLPRRSQRIQHDGHTYLLRVRVEDICERC